jgi:hypothetical protein
MMMLLFILLILRTDFLCLDETIVMAFCHGMILKSSPYDWIEVPIKRFADKRT